VSAAAGQWPDASWLLVALVRAGTTFSNGKLIERPGNDAEPEAAKRS
jgi:hypothetical protein